jgi:DNA (cytosine-5)-methyltransferase 1
MNHVGDITKLDGAKLEPVWCITGGSPCQDLSVAGKGAGLGGERSGLFHEQIRIIKEMIQHDRDLQRPDELIRPRFSIWENVPGAFSSNGGEDFRTVLEEFARIAEPDAVIPRPPKGKWHHAGAILGDGWSLAWRLFDAQYWGVPQRRKRIALVADFGGLSAPEILFERKGLSGDFEQSGAQREETAGAVGGGVKGAEPILLESNQNHATVQTDGISTTLPASMGMGGGYVPMVVNGVLPFDTTQITSPQNGCNPHYGDPCHPLAAGAHPPAIAIR